MLTYKREEGKGEFLVQLCRDNYNNQEKKLGRYKNEQATYNKIIEHIKMCRNFDELQYSPISKMYGFEPLKYQCSGYYSFNLSKKGGVIRLIVSENEDCTVLNLEFISMDHYKDFKKRLK